jgi:hypothetical protein
MKTGGKRRSKLNTLSPTEFDDAPDEAEEIEEFEEDADDEAVLEES